jgi:DNA-binding NtrC family response regulator
MRSVLRPNGSKNAGSSVLSGWAGGKHPTAGHGRERLPARLPPVPDPVSFETHDDSLGDAPASRGRSEPQLLVALECDRPAAGAARFSLAGVNEVLIGRGSHREVRRTTDHGYSTLHLLLPARTMSSVHARLVRASGQWLIEDANSRNGSFVNGERVSRAVLREADVIEVGHSLLLLRESMDLGQAPSDMDGAMQSEPPGFRTLVPRVAEDFSALKRLAPTKVPILLLGETGTGKELLARGVHALSGRRGSMISINCGALPQSLVEAQMFGHVKGAFSGATRDEPGFVRAAHEGTLFLDEVGDLSTSSQTTLLRTLQDGEVIPIGSSRATTVDVRIISATHRPLDDEGVGFRSDLLGRLAGFTLRLLPLRERVEDIGLALADILAAHAPRGGAGVTLSPELGRQLLQHGWPQNFRELQQAVCAALALASGGALASRYFPPFREEKRRTKPPPPSHSSMRDEDERLRIAVIAQLRDHQGNVRAVARSLGKAPMQIHRWMKKFGIDPNSFRGERQE